MNLTKRVFLLCHLLIMPCKSHKVTAWDFKFAQLFLQKLPDKENDHGHDATLLSASLIPDSKATSRSTWPENERYCTLHIVAHVHCAACALCASEILEICHSPPPHTLSPPHSNKMHSPLLRARPRNTQHPRAFLQQGGGVSNLIMRGHKRPGHIF